jgi:replicative DNA helicase
MPTFTVEQIREAMNNPDKIRNATVCANVDAGKCLLRGTNVLLANGDLCKVDDLSIGDKLYGYDEDYGITVKSIHYGKGEMFTVKQSNGIDYVVNSKHRLVFYFYNKNDSIYSSKYPNLSRFMEDGSQNPNVIYPIFAYQTEDLDNKIWVDFDRDDVDDREKYLMTPIQFMNLTDDEKSSLYGLTAYHKFIPTCNGLDHINNRNSILIEPYGEGEYIGFETSGCHMFALEDGTITHNSTLTDSLL